MLIERKSLNVQRTFMKHLPCTGSRILSEKYFYAPVNNYTWKAI